VDIANSWKEGEFVNWVKATAFTLETGVLIQVLGWYVEGI
jgi:hypothetical protein